MVDLFDSTTTEKYSAMYDYYLRNSHCVLLVFSVADPHGLNDALECLEKVERCTETRETMLLVANQIDSAQRCITRQQVEKAAKQHGIPFIETSALTSQNIQTNLY